MSGPSLSEAARLKEEGNAFFVAKKYKLARKKYTEAIALDDQNAILYANRSACYLALQEYLNAEDDAEKAVNLDPAYSKAWARLATAHEGMDRFDCSVSEWERALETLPVENMTPGVMKQRDQYQKSLKAVRETFAHMKLVSTVVERDAPIANLPWDLAKPLLPGLSNPAGAKSSAWVIALAHEEFENGIRMMQGLRKQGPNPENITAVIGFTGAIVELTNGVLRDSRVLGLRSAEWLSGYNDQAMLEAQSARAWGNGTPEIITREAPARLASEGWDATRPALSMTVRCWIMRGVTECELMGRPDVAVQFLGWALKVITWDRKTWPNVPIDSKGVIFRDTFLIGVKNIYNICLMKAIGMKDGKHPKYSLNKLYDEAESLINLVDEYVPDSSEQVDPGFVSSYEIYPKANAIAHQGFYYGYLSRNNASNPEACAKALANSVSSYKRASELLPLDEENRTSYLCCALHNMWDIGPPPIGEQLEIMEAVQEGIPVMREIWSNTSPACKHRDAMLEVFLHAERKLRKALADGTATLETRLLPVRSARVEDQ